MRIKRIKNTKVIAKRVFASKTLDSAIFNLAKFIKSLERKSLKERLTPPHPPAKLQEIEKKRFR